jgi:hypothetical protein
MKQHDALLETSDAGQVEKTAWSRADRPSISASEVGNYTYCARAWWLKRVGRVTPQSSQLEAGKAAHAAAGVIAVRAARAERTVRSLGWLLLVLACGLAWALLAQ